MNAANAERHWATELRNLAAGATIAALFLLPPSSPTLNRGQRRTEEQRPTLVTSVPDGPLPSDLRLARFQTRTGLETAEPPPDMQGDEDEELVLLPARLREVSGLSVTMLAQLAGVSKVTYHNWLRGERVSEANLARLTHLDDTLRNLHELRGAGLGDFLEMTTPLGRPIELLQQGDVEVVLGLALRPDRVEVSSPAVADAIWEASGLQGWIQPVASLDWDAPRLTDEELDQVLLEANPRPSTGEDMAMDDSDESPFVAHVQFVS
jgi:transcriptional regulator with XRE-family HTH domain